MVKAWARALSASPLELRDAKVKCVDSEQLGDFMDGTDGRMGI